MIIRGASLIDSGHSGLVDVLVVDGLVAQVAPAGQVPASPEHQEIELDGRLLTPGFWDEHVHMGLWAEYRRRISLEDAQSAREAAELMAAGANGSTDQILIGVGYRDGLWPDEKTAALLDDHSRGQPWLLWSVDVHSCWLNQAAMTLLGVDHAGRSGVLREQDAFALAEKLGDTDSSVRDAWVADALAAASRRGVVGIVDFDFDDNYTNWSRRRGPGGDWSVRVEAAVYPDYLDAAIARGDYTGRDIAPGVAVGPLKAITDGSLNTRTAYCVEPYQGIPGVEHGSMNYGIDDLESLMRRGHEAGFTPAFHAIGDEANRLILDLFEAVGCGGRIEHAQLVRTADFSRFAQLGVTASVQPQHAVDDRDVADRYWSDRTDRVIALRSLLDAKAHVIFGSDAPVSALDPLAQLASAVVRSGDHREPWVAHQVVGVAEALACSSRTTIQPGQPADLVALGADPVWLADALARHPAQLSRAIRDVPVELTIVDGRITHHEMV